MLHSSIPYKCVYPSISLSLYIYTYMFIYIYIYIHIHVRMHPLPPQPVERLGGVQVLLLKRMNLSFRCSFSFVFFK